MKRKKIDAGLQRRFLIGFIINKQFLLTARPIVDLFLLEPEYFRLLTKWCFDYCDSYNQPPGQEIESLFYFWAEKQPLQRNEIVDSVKKFIETLSDEYDEGKEINVPYLLDELSNYLSDKKLERLKDDIEYGLVNGETKQALSSVYNFMSVDAGQETGVEVLTDEDAWKRAFVNSAETLIPFPGDAGRFLNGAFVREGLIGVQAPEKRGKTWWCVEFVMRALRNRKKVALFEVGDLSEAQIMLRFGVRLAGRPLYKSQCGKIEIPKKIEKQEEGPAFITDKGVRKKYPINEQICMRKCDSFLRSVGQSKKHSHLMVGCYPNSTINVKGIEGVLERWEHERSFIPDVIVIDYADILAPEDKNKQTRDQVNDTWKALRKLSQEKKCLVIVPTQADSGSYDTNTQSMKNFSEDKRKLGHVTGMLGLNQTDDEKGDNIMRLNWLVLREARFGTNRCLVVGQCLDLGRAFCCGDL